MTTGSLRLRILIAAAVSIAIALFLTGIALAQLFERQFTSRVLSELEGDLLQLVSAVAIADDGTVEVRRALSNRRYEEPYGGRYWRLDFAEPGTTSPREPLQSTSLWDAELDPRAPVGPEGEALIHLTRHITTGMGAEPLDLWIIVAAHADEVERPLGQLRDQMILALGLIGVVLVLGAWLQVVVGLRPLRTLHAQLAKVSTGETQRLTGVFPAEVAPLVAEFNDVLDARAQSLERARRRAGDLAHGLKTPLTILSAIARDVRAHKLDGQAAEIEDQADAMTRHVEKTLARARLSSGRGHAAVELEPVAVRIAAALSRVPGAEELDFELDIPLGTTLPIEQEDLTELLGNLLDNARKWAKSHVRLRFDEGLLTIEDNGPGVPDAELAHITERGKRLDETKQGSGLGLSIVTDIADIYGLKIAYGRSGLGGLKVEIRL